MPMDHVSDANGSELSRLSKIYDFPDFVKQADLAATRQPQGLPVTVYADPVNRLYPCQTPASTWLSSLYFAEKQAEYHPKTAARVQQRLNHFVQVHGIKAAVDVALARWSETHKNAEDQLPDSDFAMVWVGTDGVKQRHCRMKNAGEVKVAAAWLAEHRDALTFTDRHTIATKILEKAAQYGADVSPHDGFVERQAGRGICDPKEVVAMIQDRARLAKPDLRVALTKLAEMVSTKPRAALTPPMLVKLAETVDAADRTLGLVGRYTDTIKAPEDVIFKLTLKEAQAGVGDAVALTTGSIYDRTHFSKVALADVEALFGSEFAGNVADGLNIDAEKLAEQAEALPRPDAELFMKLLDAAGVPPIQHKHAGDNAGMTPEMLTSMASRY